MTEVVVRERDRYIDIARGLASLSIIVIHTAFWSGESYVPDYIKSLTLLFDVPAFFFISGMSRSLSGKDNIISSSFKLIAIFSFIAFLYSAFFDHSFIPFIKAISINEPAMPKILPVTGSYWFVPVYIVVTILGSIILSKVKRISPYLPLLGLIYFIASYIYSFGTNGTTLGVSHNYIIFYGSLYLFGAFCYGNIENKIFRISVSLLLIVAGATVCMYIMMNHGLIRMQDQKFPVQFPYVAASMISIGGILFFHKKNMRNRFLERIGANAVFYYAAQGIGASAAILFAPMVTLEVWQFKFLTLLTVNTLVTIVFAEIFKAVFEIKYTRVKQLPVV